VPGYDRVVPPGQKIFTAWLVINLTPLGCAGTAGNLRNRGDIGSYYKELRNINGTPSGTKTLLSWKNGSSKRRTLDITALAAVEKATNSAEFGVTMIEGVEKVRFIKAQ
jgi:hypothetical protein